MYCLKMSVKKNVCNQQEVLQVLCELPGAYTGLEENIYTYFFLVKTIVIMSNKESSIKWFVRYHY